MRIDKYLTNLDNALVRIDKKWIKIDKGGNEVSDENEIEDYDEDD